MYLLKLWILRDSVCLFLFKNLFPFVPMKDDNGGFRSNDHGSNIHSEPVQEISNNVVCATSKASDQSAHTRSLIRAFASRLSILCLLSY